MADPGADFVGYMEDLAKADSERDATRALLEQHEIWRQTTWGGWAARQIQAIAKTVEPSITYTMSMFQDTNSAYSAIIANIFRFIAFLFLVVVLYLISQIIQRFIGNEIVVEEEVVIVHEHESEEAAAKARAKTTRHKKDRNQKVD
eukprot:scaffold5281_cov127-Cylindrotheca_fusiformis.AAC.2